MQILDYQDHDEHDLISTSRSIFKMRQIRKDNEHNNHEEFLDRAEQSLEDKLNFLGEVELSIGEVGDQ